MTDNASTDDARALFKAADGSMMCEAHPGFEWGWCPGGPECPGPGMPWTLTGRALIEQVIRAHQERTEPDFFDPEHPPQNCDARLWRLVCERLAVLHAELERLKGAPARAAEYSREEFERDRFGQPGDDLRAAHAAEWQPIATAPKDGTWILVVAGALQSNEVVHWAIHHEDGYDRYVWTDGEYTFCPTHWMPLPLPPGALAGQPETKDTK